LPADHPDEADEEERMIGHKKHEESQKEDRQVLLFVFFRVLCGHLSSLRGQVFMASTWLRRLSPSARICLPAVAGEICGQRSIHPQIAPIDADSGRGMRHPLLLLPSCPSSLRGGLFPFTVHNLPADAWCGRDFLNASGVESLLKLNRLASPSFAICANL
jgi:hypothetical protein